MLFKKSRLTRFLSGVLSAALVFCSLSLPDIARADASPAAQGLFANVHLPTDLGAITSQFVSSAAHPSPTVILIQDLHLHYATQKRILKILELLDQRGLLKRPIAIEGTEGAFDTSSIASYPAGKVKTELVDYFMRKGELSGDEAFSILRGEGHILFGVDDAKYYQLNRELYRHTLPNRKALQAHLSRIHDEVVILKRRHYSSELKDLDKEESYDVATAQDLLKRKLKAADALPLQGTPAQEVSLIRNLVQIDHYLPFLTRLLRQETTLEEVRYIAQRLPQFIQLTQNLLNTQPNPSTYKTADLEEIIRSAVDFYAVALMRDDPLARHTIALARQQGTVVLIAGGFHTKGVTEQLKKAGIDYAVVTPNVDEIAAGYHDLYERRMAGESVTQEEVTRDFQISDPVTDKLGAPSGVNTLRYLSPLFTKPAAWVAGWAILYHVVPTRVSGLDTSKIARVVVEGTTSDHSGSHGILYGSIALVVGAAIALLAFVRREQRKLLEGAVYQPISGRPLAGDDSGSLPQFTDDELSQARKSMQTTIFGGYDVRGIADDQKNQDITLTPAHAYLIAQALGTKFFQQFSDKTTARALVTADHRLSSPALRAAVVAGLRSVGVDVDFSPVPVPTGATSRLALVGDYDIAVQVTGSHNPADNNGLKITLKQRMDDGEVIPAALYDKELGTLFGMIREGKFHQAPRLGRIEKLDRVVEDYVNALDQILPKFKNRYRKVVDGGNGLGGKPLADLYRRRGVEVTELYTDHDGRFPNHPADPSKDKINVPYTESGVRYASEKIQELNKDAREGQIHVSGDTTDGDGDRSGAIDENGRPIPPERVLLLLYQRFILENLEGIKKLESIGHHIEMAFDVRSSGVIKELIQHINETQGIHVQGVFIPAGYPSHRAFVRNQILKIKAVAAQHHMANDADIKHVTATYTSAEASGHYFFATAPESKYPEVVVDDGIYTAVRLQHIIDTYGELEAKQPNSPLPVKDRYAMSEIFNSLPIKPVTTDIRVGVKAVDGSNPHVVKKQVVHEIVELARSRYGDQASAIIDPTQIDDGVRVEFTDGSWFLLRYSNTGAQLTSKVEAETRERLVELMNEVRGILAPYEVRGVSLKDFDAELQDQQKLLVDVTEPSAPVPGGSSGLIQGSKVLTWAVFSGALGLFTLIFSKSGPAMEISQNLPSVDQAAKLAAQTGAWHVYLIWAAVAIAFSATLSVLAMAHALWAENSRHNQIVKKALAAEAKIAAMNFETPGAAVAPRASASFLAALASIFTSAADRKRAQALAVANLTALATAA